MVGHNRSRYIFLVSIFIFVFHSYKSPSKDSPTPSPVTWRTNVASGASCAHDAHLLRHIPNPLSIRLKSDHTPSELKTESHQDDGIDLGTVLDDSALIIIECVHVPCCLSADR